MMLGRVKVKAERGGISIRVRRPTTPKTSQAGKSLLLTDPKERYELPDGTGVRIVWCIPNQRIHGGPGGRADPTRVTRFGKVEAELDGGELIIRVNRPPQPKLESGRLLHRTDPEEWLELPDGSRLNVDWSAPKGWRRGQVISGGRIESSRRRF